MVVAELYRVIDVTSHEHDVRGAVGRPGHRDAPAVAYALKSVVETLAAWWPAGLPAVRLAGDSGALRRPPAHLRAGGHDVVE